ncbi:MAG: hypothetical protein AVDCRST_MAG10-1921, partial [uncultured Acidimicrobiales bacterium]
DRGEGCRRPSVHGSPVGAALRRRSGLHRARRRGRPPRHPRSRPAGDHRRPGHPGPRVRLGGHRPRQGQDAGRAGQGGGDAPHSPAPQL